MSPRRAKRLSTIADPKAANVTCMMVPPAIARGEFSRSYFYSAFHSGRMFNEADVYGGSRKLAAGEHSTEFSNLAHR